MLRESQRCGFKTVKQDVGFSYIINHRAMTAALCFLSSLLPHPSSCTHLSAGLCIPPSSGFDYAAFDREGSRNSTLTANSSACLLSSLLLHACVPGEQKQVSVRARACQELQTSFMCYLQVVSKCKENGFLGKLCWEHV